MKTYWDASAVINAAVSGEVMARLATGEHFTRLHTLSEFFATMTGRGVKVLHESGEAAVMVFTPNQCAAWLRRFADRVEIVDLEKADVLAALDKAQSRSIQGGRIYDYLHALAASKAKADELLTRNTDDFKSLSNKLSWP